jgi:hypothetical protein
MGTEKFWQEEKKRIGINSDTINPIIAQTKLDAKENVPARNAKLLYTDCLQGALFWNQWAKSDDLSEPDMAMIICRDTGCDLTYCQASMADPYERPFDNCDQQFKQLNNCIAAEQRRYALNPEGRTMQEHISYMLEKKKKEKYMGIFQDQKIDTTAPIKEREYIVKEQNPSISMDYNEKL